MIRVLAVAGWCPCPYEAPSSSSMHHVVLLFSFLLSLAVDVAFLFVVPLRSSAPSFFLRLAAPCFAPLSRLLPLVLEVVSVPR